MPEKDGLATTKEIREHEGSHGITPSHIICYTADGTDNAKRLIIDAKFDDIMYKPPPPGFLENLFGRIQYHGKDLPHLK